MPENTTARERFAALAESIESRWNVATDTDDDRAGTLHLYGAIGGYWGGVDANELVPAIRALDVDTLNVYVNSPGGNVYDGIAIRNALRQHKARVVITIDGLAASAASFIACAGDEVIMAENSEFMIHEAWGYAIGNAEDMREHADDLDRISGNIAAMYASKAGGDADDWRALMKAETWYSAAEAVAAGLADRTDATVDDEDADAEATNLFDLTMYAHAGRAAASAPVPVAAMASHRKERPMELTREQLDQALAEQSEAQNRILETRLASIGGTPQAGPSWPTFGHFLKALVAGDSNAMSFYETNAAYDGSTTADDKQPNTWVRDAIHLIRRTRKIMGEFSTQPLPGDGMTLEYLQLKSNSIAVAKQTAQGADLVKGKIQLDSKSTPVETYGGWTEFTRQQIDRGSAAYLTTGNTAMTLEYARATEEVIRDLLRGIIATKLADTDNPVSLTIAADADAYDWLDLIVDAAGLFDDLSFNLDGGLVSKDVFKRLIRLEDSNGNSLMRVWGTGMNQVGELDLREITGDLASVQFKILPGAPANTLEFHDRLGITTWESPGAPFRLQDSNIVNLTEAVSQYGYLAAASQFPDAIQVVQVGAPVVDPEG